MNCKNFLKFIFISIIRISQKMAKKNKKIGQQKIYQPITNYGIVADLSMLCKNINLKVLGID